MYTTSNCPDSINNKPLEQRQLFVAVANENITKGRSIEEANLAGLLAVKQKYRPEKLTKRKIPDHIALLTKAKESTVKSTDSNPKFHQAFLGKQALVPAERNLVSADFDSEGRLVLMFDTGEKITTKPAPAEQVTVNRTVVVQPQTEPAVTTEEELYAKRIDFINDNLFYKGEAQPGSSENNMVWRISLVTISLDGDVSETWANGSASFNKSWTDRLTYVYN